MLVFLVIHHVWIKPIWAIFPAGLFIAALGGLAVGWSYAEIKTGLPSRPWTAMAVFVLVGATLVPAIVLAQLRPPLLDIVTFTIPQGTTKSAVAHFVIELLLTASLVGSTAGWWLGHNWRAAVSTGLAGFVFALGPGHNIPFLGNTPSVGKGILLLIAIIFVSALVLVEVEAWLTK